MEHLVDFKVGQFGSLRRTVSEAEVETFSRATGDKNPVHLDESYAAGTRFKHRIAHGMLAASYISALLGNEFPGPGTIYVSQSLNFLRPVFLGDELTVKATVTAYQPERALVTLETVVLNQHGKKVLAGEAVCLVEDLAVPRPAPSGAAAS
jgi:3-hydroxybutyryl-CoA dehydratase